MRGRKVSWFLVVTLLMFTVAVSGFLVPGVVEASPAPKIMVDPPSIVDSSKVPGETFTVNINVSDIPGTSEIPGLWAYEFYLDWGPIISYPVEPIVNPNFTDTGSTAWYVTKTVSSGTATNGYDTGDGNPSPGSGSPSYFVRATSTASAMATVSFYVKQTFNWDFGTPATAKLSFAYKISGNAIDMVNSLWAIRVLPPSGSAIVLVGTYYFGNPGQPSLKTGFSAWSYNSTDVLTSAFMLSGTYELQLRAYLRTNATGTDKYVQVGWDDVGLQLGPIIVSESTFLQNKPGGGSQDTYFMWKYFEDGYLYVANTIIGTPYVSGWPVPGNGVLATITFYVEGTGDTALDLYNTKLLTIGVAPDYPMVPITHTSYDGYFANSAGIVHDVAVTSVTASPTSVSDGQIVNINATVKNEGTATETFTVTTYYNTNPIETKPVSNLAANANTTLNYAWNTSGVSPGTYTIKAVASTVSGETDTADNTFIDGTVTVSYTHNVAVTSVTPTPTTVDIGETVNITVVARNKGAVTETFTVTTYYSTNPIETKPVTNLAAGADQTLLFVWNTTNSGTYTIKAVASNVSGEIYTADNTYIDGSVQVNDIHDVAVTSVTASPTAVWPGENVTVTVVIKNEGTASETLTVETYYNKSGSSWLIGYQVVMGTGFPPGSNKTLTFTWNTTSVLPGVYTVWARAILTDNDPSDNTKYDGTVTILSQHDVAVLSVTPSAVKVYIKQTLNITVVVKNEGGYTENFTVTVYRNDTILIGTLSVTNLASDTNTTLIFSWNTAGAALGVYTIKAVAATVPGETDTADNTLTDGTITLTISDTNGDGTVDVFDLAIIGRAWFTYVSDWIGKPLYVYVAKADFNGDGFIDVSDFQILALNWGDSS